MYVLCHDYECVVCHMNARYVIRGCSICETCTYTKFLAVDLFMWGFQRRTGELKAVNAKYNVI